MAQATTTTTLAALKTNASAAKPGDNASSVGLVDGESFALAQRVANVLASSTLVPKAYQGNLPNCIIALNMAARIGADPMMVMQNLYVVHGTPSWSSQFLIASFNKCGRFSALRYEFSGKPDTDSWGCRAWALEKGTGERIEGAVVTIALAKKEGWYGKNGSKWQTMPQQMLMYRAASWFVRAFAPEIAMGLQTAEEMHDVYDMTQGQNGHYEMSVAEIAAGQQVEAEPTQPAPAEETPVEHEPTDEGDGEAITSEEPFPASTVFCPHKEKDVDELECPGCSMRAKCPSWDE